MLSKLQSAKTALMDNAAILLYHGILVSFLNQRSLTKSP